MQPHKDFEFNLRELAAIRCHATQLGSSPMMGAPAGKQCLFFGVEYFV